MTKYFHNLLKNMNKSNTTCDYLQEKIRIATDEQHRKSTLLMNLMFPRDDQQSKATSTDWWQHVMTSQPGTLLHSSLFFSLESHADKDASANQPSPKAMYFTKTQFKWILDFTLVLLCFNHHPLCFRPISLWFLKDLFICNHSRWSSIQSSPPQTTNNPLSPMTPWMHFWSYNCDKL